MRGVHNDKFDAQKIALLGLKPKLKTSVVPNDNVAAVKTLVREYHSMKKEYTQYICRLTSQLRQTFPQYLPLFSKVNGKASLEILFHYSTPEAILYAEKGEIIAVLTRHGRGKINAAESMNVPYRPRRNPRCSDTQTPETCISFDTLLR